MFEPLDFCRPPSFRSNVSDGEEDRVGVGACTRVGQCWFFLPWLGLPSRIRPNVLKMRIIGGKRTLETVFFTLVDPDQE